MNTATADTKGTLDETVVELARVFARAGYELFLVGGCVRDSLLGRPVHDLDLATDAPPAEIKRLASSVRPTATYDVGARFGTIGLIFTVPLADDAAEPALAAADLPGLTAPAGVPASAAGLPSPAVAGVSAMPASPSLDGMPATLTSPAASGEPAMLAAPTPPGTERQLVEITTYRTEQYLDGTRKPVVAFGTSLHEDLARRDFTINAIARDVLTGEVHDPFGGRDDLQRRIIRAVGQPGERFEDDPLRLLRAVRFTSQLGFTIEPQTLDAIREHARSLQRISRERIAVELSKILISDRPDDGMRLATDLGLMAIAIPEVLPMRGVSQRPAHHKDVFEHTLGVIRNIPPKLLLRWTALLHDIGKPQTKSVQGGAVHFFGHEDLGERLARRILTSLHFDRQFIEKAGKLVRMHLRINSYEPDWSDAAVRRLIREAGDVLRELVLLSRADVTSYRQERIQAAASRADEFERRCRELMEQEDVARLHSPLDGNDLMALFGRPPGPWIRPLKDYLLDLVIEGELDQDDRATGERLARQYAAEHDLF